VPIKGIPSWDHFGKDIMDWGLSDCYTDDNGKHWLDIQTDVDDNSHERIKAPWNVGDVLYVREACRFTATGIQYRADQSTLPLLAFKEPIARVEYEKWKSFMCRNGWTGNQNMLKAVARTRLKVTRVWVEQVRDISEEDAIAEGVTQSGDWPNPSDEFRILWDSLYGKKHSWSSNPWVWACEFERVKQ
jgi:hypothetical protein